jgi:hypothetical protein
VHGRAGERLVAGCERFDRKTYQHYKPGFLNMKFKDVDQTVTCRTTPPPRKGYTWDSQRGWVPVGDSGL